MRRRIAAMVAMVLMVMMSAAPALAHHDVDHVKGHVNQGHQDDDNAHRDQGGGNNHIKQNRGGGND